MQRRTILGILAAAPLLGVRALAATPKGDIGVKQLQDDWRALLPAGARPPAAGERLELTDAQWKKRLTAAQYDVLRHEGTEAAGSSPLNHELRPGVFACAGCGLPLFSSAMKYDSGTGWPSFFTHIPGALQTKRDFRLIWPRTEYHCARCGGHQGHVFSDGPPPTGQRWCNNGVALSFLPKEA
ncbi:MAG TPA: peptide-methionine (R)-S-oxide reductase MsrB [Burkholderiales bacterium]|nr:peptide-methionine (R)-S-oxide reductase MsrB [Burkholderiales bacterium]